MTRLAIMAAGTFVMAMTVAAAPAAAGDWPNWRGPNHDGSTDATGLPTGFSKTEGVKWSADLPGPSSATPIIVGDRVFVSSTDFAKMQLVAMCLERTTGKMLWRHEVHSGYKAPGAPNALQVDDKGNIAASSPVCDGNVVAFLYGNGDLIAFDLAGKKLWSKNLQQEYGDFTYQWTYSASPTLHKGMLYVPVLQRNQPVHGRGKDGAESYLLALKPETGEVLWKHVRPSNAKMESLESYATPIPVTHNGREELIIAGGDCLTGHDPATGRELWRWGTWNPDHREQWWRLVPSAVVGNGVVLGCAPKRAPVYAVKLGLEGTHKGSDGLAWDSEQDKQVSSDVPTPLFYRDHFFVLSDVAKSLSKVDPATGKAVWSTPMPGRYLWRGSPTGADGKVWCINHHADVVVLDAESGKIVAQIAMGGEDEDNVQASIAVAGENLFIRTANKLYCIGK